MEHELIDQRITFTLDLEDHRPVRDRRGAVSRDSRGRVLEFLGDRGRCAARSSSPVRSPRTAPTSCATSPSTDTSSASTGCTTCRSPSSSPTQLREEAKRGKALLEDLGGHAGARLPRAAVLARPRVALGRRRARRARLHVLVERAAGAQPAVRRSHCAAGAVPLAERRDRAPVPGGAAWAAWVSPTSAASTCARCPRPRSTPPAAPSARTSCSGSTATRTTSTPTEPFWVVPEVGRLGSRLLWYNRSHMFEKIEALLADGSAPPLGERIDSLETVEYPAKASSEYSQLDMVHRLPKAKLVDRFDYLTQLCAGRRVVHVGFADIGCQSLNEEADAWLHTHLAAVGARARGSRCRRQGVALRPRARLRGARRRLQRRRRGASARPAACRRRRRGRGDRAHRRREGVPRRAARARGARTASSW